MAVNRQNVGRIGYDRAPGLVRNRGVGVRVRRVAILVGQNAVDINFDAVVVILAQNQLIDFLRAQVADLKIAAQPNVIGFPRSRHFRAAFHRAAKRAERALPTRIVVALFLPIIRRFVDGIFPGLAHRIGNRRKRQISRLTGYPKRLASAICAGSAFEDAVVGQQAVGLGFPRR